MKCNLSFFINTPTNKITEDITTSILKKSNALSFHSSLPNYRETPLIHLPSLSKKYNVGNIFIKDESFRFDLNAFKVLGASYAISEILKQKPHASIFCTATDGNHGRAVAWSANLFKKKAVIIVPEDTTNERIKAIEKEGAIVTQIQGNYDQACGYAKKLSQENQWELVQDMSWKGYEQIPANIMAGYKTIFYEIENQISSYINSNIDIVFLQAGVGSFAGAGINYFLQKYGTNRPKIVIVEPKEADAVFTSLQHGRITTSNGNSKTIMAGLNCGTPSLGAWNLLKNGVDLSIKIDDLYSKTAIRELYFSTGEDQKINSGESGAAGLAGFLAMKNAPECNQLQTLLNINKKSKILFINTEGVTDKESFRKIITSHDE